MDNFTQRFIYSIDYKAVLSRILLPKPIEPKYHSTYLSHIIVLLGLSFGLPTKTILSIYWKNIITVDSRGRIKVLDRLILKGYLPFEIHKKLQYAIDYYYKSFNQPNLNSTFSELAENKNDNNRINRSVYFFLNGKMAMTAEKNYLFSPHILQIIFARRVLACVGHSNSTVKFLKSKLKIRLNEKLFNFLDLDEKETKIYDLNNVTIFESKFLTESPTTFIEDNKHFGVLKNTFGKRYCFQHFMVFYDFLKSQKLSDLPHHNQSIVLLLLLGLSSGIRLSSFLKLNWSDLSKLNSTENKLEFRQGFRFKNRIINNELIEMLQDFFFRKFEAVYGLTYSDSHFSLNFSSNPVLAIPVFETRLENRLSQPSLLRELKNTLNRIGFRYTKYFKTKSTQIMYGRRIVEIKGNHPATLKALKEHFGFRSYQQLFAFLNIEEYKVDDGKRLKSFDSIYEHILYDL